jgi:hypothetical protein
LLQIGRCFPEDRFGDFHAITQDVSVPEPQNAKAVSIEIRRSHRVIVRGIRLAMLGAVDLHDYSGPKARKIDDVTSDRVLTPKMPTQRFHAAQPRPKQALRERCVPSQLPRALTRHRLYPSAIDYISHLPGGEVE